MSEQFFVFLYILLRRKPVQKQLVTLLKVISVFRLSENSKGLPTGKKDEKVFPKLILEDLLTYCFFVIVNMKVTSIIVMNYYTINQFLFEVLNFKRLIFLRIDLKYIKLSVYIDVTGV